MISEALLIVGIPQGLLIYLLLIIQRLAFAEAI